MVLVMGATGVGKSFFIDKLKHGAAIESPGLAPGKYIYGC